MVQKRRHVQVCAVLGHAGPAHIGPKHQRQDQEDRKRHGRSGKGNGDFSRGPLGDPVKLGHTTNRQQGDTGGLDSIAARHQGVSEFVRHDTGKQGKDERHIPKRRGSTAIGIGGHTDPGDKHEEGDMDPDVRPHHFSQAERPCHFFTR